MQKYEKSAPHRVVKHLTAMIAIAALILPGMAHAQSAPVRAVLGTFLDIGGYFQTDASGRGTIGDPKFSSDTRLYVRPKHERYFNITGGLEIFSASDHFFPFTGGDQYSLIGPSFRVMTRRVVGRVQPYISGGLFVGRLRSEQQGFDRSNFTPSVNFGAEWPFARYFTLAASYRVSQHIHGVNSDGFNLELRVF